MFNFTYIHTVKHFYFFILLFIIGSCSLNAAQESALNQSKNEYIGARNEGVIISYVAYTHPNVVGFYKDLGDEAFIERFDLHVGVGSLFLQDGSIKETNWDGDNIQVKYEFMGILETEFRYEGDPVFIYALSADDGKSWHFLEEKDYFNSKIIKPKDRLIKK
ncbi:MAG: hypothetical protein ACJA1C_000605 [Crocinitomicaceae bacterium]|jgi:hypothetical protein